MRVLTPPLQLFLKQVRDAVAPRGGPMPLPGQKAAGGGPKGILGGGGPVPEALVCVGALSQALQVSRLPLRASRLS